MKKETIIGASIITAVVGLITLSRKRNNIEILDNPDTFYPLVKPLIKRGCNSSGCGHFGAGRGDRVHNGLDFNAAPGSPVYAPFDGVVLRNNVKPYANNDFLKGIEIRDSNGEEMKIFYMEPIKSVGQHINAGDVIGYVQDVAQFFSASMPNHIHAEIRRDGVVYDFTNKYLDIA